MPKGETGDAPAAEDASPKEVDKQQAQSEWRAGAREDTTEKTADFANQSYGKEVTANKFWADDGDDDEQATGEQTVAKMRAIKDLELTKRVKELLKKQRKQKEKLDKKAKKEGAPPSADNV